MGRIADQLRATLEQMKKSDERFLRRIEEHLDTQRKLIDDLKVIDNQEQ